MGLRVSRMCRTSRSRSVMQTSGRATGGAAEKGESQSSVGRQPIFSSLLSATDPAYVKPVIERGQSGAGRQPRSTDLS